MSEIKKAGQPPRVLSPEEQKKLRTVCRVCFAFSCYTCNTLGYPQHNLFDHYYLRHYLLINRTLRLLRLMHWNCH